MSNPITNLEYEQALTVIQTEAYKFAEKVQPIYQAMNWTWFYNSGERIPTVDDIYLHILSLSRALSKETDQDGISSGRLRVEFRKISDREGSYVDVVISLVPEQIRAIVTQSNF
jgi:hypothetical protein